MSHLLVTNDFPPKVGGIQAYLWELWRRLPPGTATVLTPSFEGDADFDDAQPFRVVRVPDRVLLPTPGTVRRIDRLAAELDVDGVLLDPAMPVGLVGPRLERRYGLVLHGAYITSPVKCAPPANKPTADERAQCRPYLERELTALPDVSDKIAPTEEPAPTPEAGEGSPRSEG